MSILSSCLEEVTDFLFPRSTSIRNMERLSSGELMAVLPRARETDEDISALFDYQDPLVKECVWEVKYSGNKKLAGLFGEILADFICHELAERILFSNFTNPLLVPIPMADRRRAERGWNQTEIICRAILANRNVNFFEYIEDALIKVLHTESQTKTQNKEERRENLKNSMLVKYPEKIVGGNIILVDDVTTTGATFAEARRALREAGAKKILCVALAH